jgi:hypothetical protein
MMDGVVAGGWRLLRVLGAPGGALLDPVAGRTRVIAADTADNRVLGWVRPPVMIAETVAMEGVSAAPATDDRYGELLAIADSGNNRVVLWQLPLDRP